RVVRGGSAQQGDVTITPMPNGNLHRPPGANTIYLIEAGSTRIAHLGSLREPLTTEQVAALGRVDVLLLPVGGAKTLGPEEAVNVVRRLDPKVVIPMHYRTVATDPALRGELRPVTDFTVQFPDVEFKDDYVALLASNTLPQKTQVWVLKYRA